MTKVKNTDCYRKNVTKGCHGQTAESQAGKSKGKLTNKVTGFQSDRSQYPKNKNC